MSNPLLADRAVCSGGYTAFSSRDCYGGYYYSSGCCYQYSSWYWWGRWVFAGVVVIFFIALIAMLACVNSRRRRARGQPAVYGTGWMAPPKYTPGNQHQQYPGPGPLPPYAPPGQQPPQQVPQNTGSAYATTDGYYGNHQQYHQTGNDIPLQPQPPQNAYYPRGGVGEADYAPPAGPPPTK